MATEIPNEKAPLKTALLASFPGSYFQEVPKVCEAVSVLFNVQFASTLSKALHA